MNAVLLAGTVLVLLAVVLGPMQLVPRALRIEPLVAVAAAPALAAAAAAVGAIVCTTLSVPWSALPFAAVLLLALALARIAGPALASSTAEPESHEGLRAALVGRVPLAPLWLGGAAVVAVAPILAAFGRADGILERWDTLYHLSALARIRATGDGSSLTLGALSNTQGSPVFYPAAFHDLATVVPGVPVAILLNAAAYAFSVVPWALGLAALARTLWRDVHWAPFAAALVGLLIPASPLDEWVHLSPLPNLTGMAFLPGALACALALWRRLLAARGRRAVVASLTSLLAITGALLVGLALLQPNAAVMMLLLLAVLTGGDAARRIREHPLLVVLPFLCLVPVALLQWTPLGSRVTAFTGGLQVPPGTALGEIVTGLLTVWPMAIGAVIALLWWPGLAISAARGPRRLAVAWLVVAVLYFDAAIDSPLDLSVLFYRGQDRLAMPLAMLSALLAVPGLQAWSRLRDASAPHRNRVTAGLAAIAVLIAGASVPARVEHASRNASLDAPGRPRFLQADEIAALDAVAPHLDPHGAILASPLSGASQIAAVRGLRVRWPVAGMGQTPQDRALLAAVEDPASRRSCIDLEQAEIRYVYVEADPYQSSPAYRPLERARLDGFGTPLAQTEHSALYAVPCGGGARA